MLNLDIAVNCLSYQGTFSSNCLLSNVANTFEGFLKNPEVYSNAYTIFASDEYIRVVAHDNTVVISLITSQSHTFDKVSGANYTIIAYHITIRSQENARPIRLSAVTIIIDECIDGNLLTAFYLDQGSISIVARVSEVMNIECSAIVVSELPTLHINRCAYVHLMVIDYDLQTLTIDVIETDVVGEVELNLNTDDGKIVVNKIVPVPDQRSYFNPIWETHQIVTKMIFKNVEFNFDTLHITDNFGKTSLDFKSYSCSGKTIEIYLNEYSRELTFDTFDNNKVPKIKIISGEKLSKDSVVSLYFGDSRAPQDWIDSIEISNNLVWDPDDEYFCVKSGSALESWEIALIVIACVIVVGAIAGVVIWFIIKRKKENDVNPRVVYIMVPSCV